MKKIILAILLIGIVSISGCAEKGVTSANESTERITVDPLYESRNTTPLYKNIPDLISQEFTVTGTPADPSKIDLAKILDVYGVELSEENVTFLEAQLERSECENRAMASIILSDYDAERYHLYL